MIAYFKDRDVTVEVPDDISESELADIQKNFGQYVQSEGPDSSIDQKADEFGEITQWKPNFYQSSIEPVLQEFGIVDYAPISGKTPGAQAFVGKAVESFTFGAAKPLTDVFEPAYKDHPVYSFLGELAGGVGSLMTTGGVLRATKLPKIAAVAGQAATKYAEFAPRFITPSIMAGATFGTNTFIKETVKSLQEGNVDIANFGASVVKDTALGTFLGGISGVANPVTAITSAAGLGFISSKMEGGDDAESLLNAGIWGIFEAVGSFGREARLRKDALKNLSETIGEYVFKRNPKVGAENAQKIGQAIVLKEAEKVGGIDAIVNSEKEATLSFIEKLNQRIRNGKVRTRIQETPKTEPGGDTGVQFSAPASEPNPTPDAGAPPQLVRISASAKDPSRFILTDQSGVQVSGGEFPSKEVAKKGALALGYEPEFTEADIIAGIRARLEGGDPAKRVIIRDEEGNVIRKEASKSTYPSYFLNKGYTKAETLKILDKVENGKPLTPKQQAIYDDLKAGESEMAKAELERMKQEDLSSFDPSEFDPDYQKPESFAQPAEEEVFYDQEGGQGKRSYRSSKGEGRQYGSPEDQKASLHKSLGGLEYVQKMKGVELVKLAKQISGDVPLIKSLSKSLGFFKPSDETITLDAELFKDPKLWEAVLAHEIGHLMDYQPGAEKTMSRGNVLGRIASLKDYRKTLLPEGPHSKEKILTDADRRRFRSMAEKVAKGEAEKAAGQKTMLEPEDGAFEPQAILDVWNNATADIDKNLLDYIKGLNTEQKKSIVKQAMAALRKGEKLSIPEIKKFNKEVSADPRKVADIYKDLIKQEIKKRKLWEEEVIQEEMKNLSMFWKPFNPDANVSFTEYRFSSPELYADFVSVLLNAPGKVKEIAPNSYKAFFNYLENKPEVMKSLLELQALTQADDADLQKVRADDILKMFERGEDAFTARQADFEAAQKSIWDKLRVIFWDKNSILLDERNKLKKSQSLPPAQDAQYAIEKNSMMGNFVKSHLEDFDQLVYKPAKEADVLDDLKIMLFLDRVGDDRTELANPLGYTPETAQAVLDNMRKEDPVKFDAVTELANRARDWFKTISQIPGAEDFWTPQQIFTMGLSDKYAPYRVVDYMKDNIYAYFPQLGTFKDIGDPLTSLAMKGISVVTAIERNRLKKIVGNMLLKTGIEMRQAKITNYPGVFKIEDPSEDYLGTLAWKENGQWVAYHIDKYIADTFNVAATEKIGAIGGVLNTIFANDFFRKTFITFNPGFQAVNLFRDFLTTWKRTPGLKIGQALKLYAESIPQAKARAKGQFDPLIQEMERAGALQLTLNDIILGQTSEDRELEAILQKHDIIESRELKYQGVPILEQITGILDWLRYVGDTIETIPKVVGWKALDHMSEEERSYFVRNLVGTPNPRRSGTGAPIYNAVYLFSNIFKEGFRGLIEAGFTNTKTRGSYWIKTLQSSIIPKMVMGMIGAGLFGAGLKSIIDKASEYHKTNYIVIPLGVDAQGNGVYITLPQDEDARLIGGIFWKMLNHKGNLTQNLADILSFGAEQFPGVAPLPLMAGAWVEFLKGGNPKDSLRGQDILTDQERSAGGKYAFEPMVRWTLNNTGLVRLDVRDKLKDEPLHKTIVSSLPILNRFIRITRQGEREIAKDAKEAQRQIEDRTSLDVKDAARDAIRSGQSVEEFTKKAESREESDKMRRAYDELKKGFTNDPRVQEINRATSSDQKIAILKTVRKSFSGKEAFNDFVDDLYSNKIISARVALEVRY